MTSIVKILKTNRDLTYDPIEISKKHSIHTIPDCITLINNKGT